MNNSKLIECPICNTEHNVECVREPSTTIIKNKRVHYNQIFYRCQNRENDNEFVDGELLERNLRAARLAYELEYGEE